MSSLELSLELSADPHFAFAAWLNPIIQGQMTEQMAEIDPRPNGRFRLWGGAVEGKFIAINAYSNIKMTWRTVEFTADMADTIIELHFKATKKGCRLVVTHTEIPPAMESQFKFAWKDYIFPRFAMVCEQRPQ